MKKRLTSRLFLLSIILLFWISFISAPGVNTYTVKQSEASLNVQGFDSGNAFDFSFGDSVNLYSGNLVVTATDIYLPGRNGLDVSITRQYNSNIFLHRNQCTTLGGEAGNSRPCTRNNPSYNALCSNCDLPNTQGLSGIYTSSCCTKDPLASSWEKAKWLGRGWDMTFGKVKDPTALFFDQLYSYSDFPKGIPLQGVNSMSLVLQNSESGVIHPSRFILGDEKKYPFPWGTNLFYGMYSDNIFGSEMAGDEGSIINPGYAIYTALVEGSLSPLILKYSQDSSLGAGGIGAGIPLTTEPIGATYTSNGIHYEFNRIVQFCSPYDDLPPNGVGGCMSQNHPNFVPNNPYDWAENPYAGLYLKNIIDKAGNHITFKYYGEDLTPPIENREISPYVYSITDSLGREVIFNVGAETGINGKIGSIEYPNYKGDIFRVRYVYNDPQGTLLEQIHLDKRGAYQGGGNYAWTLDVLPPTLYGYDSDTQELISIRYPNGLSVSYNYLDIDLLTVNLNEYEGASSEVNYDTKGRKTKHRAVVERRVNVPGENGGNPYVWTYEYTTEGWPISNYPLSVTTVTDPLGNRVRHKFLPPVARIAHFNSGESGSGFANWGYDYDCGYSCEWVSGGLKHCTTVVCESIA